MKLDADALQTIVETPSALRTLFAFLEAEDTAQARAVLGACEAPPIVLGLEALDEVTGDAGARSISSMLARQTRETKPLPTLPTLPPVQFIVGAA